MNNSHKTIAIVINTSWNIFNFRLGLLQALSEEGYRIVAIAPKDNYSKRLQDLGFEYHDIKMNNKGTNPLEDIKLIFDLYQLYKKIKPDILLQYTIKPNIYGSIAAAMLNIPVISNISGLGTIFLNDNFSSKIAKLLYKTALKIPQKVFYQNIHDRALFIESQLVHEEKTDLLPGSGIDTDKFKPIETDSGQNGTIRFLFIARLVKDKGLIEYVKAARMVYEKYSASDTKKIQKIEFCILGSFYPGNPTAVSQDEMEEWIGEGIVDYLGSSDDVKSFIAKSDCVVLPSYREGLSRVLLESASMAKPIITTNVPGCQEVVDHGVNGYLCMVKDVDSLAEQMEKMILLSDQERKEMGKYGRQKTLKEFDEKIVIEKYKEAIADLFYP